MKSDIGYLANFHVNYNTRRLFELFDEQVKSIDKEVWAKVAKTTISYYAPKKVFVFTYPLKDRIKVELFTGGKAIEGVESINRSSRVRKWGVLYLRNDEQLSSTMEAVKMSYQLLKEAISRHEPTGWFS